MERGREREGEKERGKKGGGRDVKGSVPSEACTFIIATR